MDIEILKADIHDSDFIKLIKMQDKDLGDDIFLLYLAA
jgi:hypothetical protein